MKNNITELVFILDRSGSMSGLESDTIGGFNSMIEKQKKQDGKAYVSTILFDNVSEVIHDRVSLEKVHPMTENDYYVRGCTALLDAIGGAIHHIENRRGLQNTQKQVNNEFGRAAIISCPAFLLKIICMS